MGARLNKSEKELYERVIKEEIAKNENVASLRIVWEIHKSNPLHRHTFSQMATIVRRMRKVK